MNPPASVLRSPSRERAKLLTKWSLSGGGVFFVALGLAAWRFQSDLALAQASDSFLDMMGALILAWTVRIASQPRDRRHPLGRGRAEPLGALAISVLDGILAVEVCSVCVRTLLGTPNVELSNWLLAAFLGKATSKGRLSELTRGKSLTAALPSQNALTCGDGYQGASLMLPPALLPQQYSSPSFVMPQDLKAPTISFWDSGRP